MKVIGKEYLHACLSQSGYFLKLILNEHSAHFFTYTTEHRDASLPGLKYCDDSEGNAIAATIKPTQIDIRLHSAFSAERVKAIVAELEGSLGDSPNSIVLEVYYGSQQITSIKIQTSPSLQ